MLGCGVLPLMTVDTPVDFKWRKFRTCHVVSVHECASIGAAKYLILCMNQEVHLAIWSVFTIHGVRSAVDGRWIKQRAYVIKKGGRLPFTVFCSESLSSTGIIILPFSLSGNPAGPLIYCSLRHADLTTPLSSSHMPIRNLPTMILEKVNNATP